MTKFSNPELQRVHDENKHVIEEHLQSLDEISRDIKEIEQFFCRAALPSFNFSFGDFDLCWCNKRICYEDDEVIKKPLMDTRVHVRLRCKPYLKEFFSRTLNAVTSKQKESL